MLDKGHLIETRLSKFHSQLQRTTNLTKDLRKTRKEIREIEDTEIVGVSPGAIRKYEISHFMEGETSMEREERNAIKIHSRNDNLRPSIYK